LISIEAILAIGVVIGLEDNGFGVYVSFVDLGVFELELGLLTGGG
jgi:hypothetical protein